VIEGGVVSFFGGLIQAAAGDAARAERRARHADRR
jgi:hypothetical protein